MHQQVGLRRTDSRKTIRRSRHSNVYINMANKTLAATPPNASGPWAKTSLSFTEEFDNPSVPLTIKHNEILSRN